MYLHEMTGMSMPAAAAASGGAHSDHLPALTALIYLPIALVVFMLAVEAGRVGGVRLAVRFADGYRQAGSAAKLAALLMAMTGAMHLALVPGHLAEAPTLGVLFLLNGIALGIVVVAMFLVPNWWRPVAAALLAATVLTYAFYILTGREDADAIGLFTKVIELAALGLVAFGSRLDIILGRITPHSLEASL